MFSNWARASDRPYPVISPSGAVDVRDPQPAFSEIPLSHLDRFFTQPRNFDPKAGGATFTLGYTL